MAGRALAVSVFYTAAAIYFTWPLAARIGTHSIGHIDPAFSAWRLAWVARQLMRGAPALFDANIFYPARRVLAYSDAMLLQGALAVPLTWMGLSPVVIVNLMTLVAMVTCACGAYLLARRLSGYTGPALVAGLVFAFAPARMDHLAHLELQWACWMPLAFWAWHRTLDKGRFLDGLLCGVFVLLQLLSSIYYGIFLVTALAVVGLLTLVRVRFRLRAPAWAGLATGAVLLGVVAVQYAEPYQLAQKRVGERGVDETRRYSATLVSFVSTRPDNRLYGDLTGRWTDEEGRLFPGITPVVLGGVAFAPPIAATAIAYGGGLAFTAGAALGMNGPIYPVIRAALPAFRGLRAPARYGVLIQLCLSVLAALGLARLARWRPRYSTALTAASLALITLEYSARPVLLMGLAGAPPPIYRWLSLQVPGTVTLELPVPKPDVLPEMDPFYTYNSVWHWQPLINGYSGHYYPPYLDLLKSLTTFPSPESTRMLTLAGVHLVIVHKEMIPKGRYEPLIARLDADPDYRLIKIADDEVGEARAYVFLPNYGKSADSPGSGR